MMFELSDNTKATLLLTAPLIVGGKTPRASILNAREYRRLANRMHVLGARPADLLKPNADAILSECADLVDKNRAFRLLGRSLLLSQAVERWRSRAIWVLSRADERYPAQLKERLKKDAPNLLYGCGDVDLAQGGLAVVGPRNAGDSLLAYAGEVGALAASSGQVIVSGAARGIDRAAMNGALEAGGAAVGVLPGGLAKASVNREHRNLLLDKRLLLVSPWDPQSRFNVGFAMQRNKVIYGLAQAALVIEAMPNKGGTWSGAIEQLNKYRTPLYVRSKGEPSPGLAALAARGASSWADPGNAEEFDALLAQANNFQRVAKPARQTDLLDAGVNDAPHDLDSRDDLPAERQTVESASSGRIDESPKQRGIPAEFLPERPPQPGELVQVRSRRWLVEETAQAPNPGESARISLACADDDNQGQTLKVFWECEPDRRILEDEGWDNLATKGFDPTRRFAAFYNTLRWHCTTATDPNLFQAPFRAGIKIDAYQMEPLRKALLLPRVNLFIADDTGLGKTIEAGLIARELIQRRKARIIVVAAPPSVIEQWKAELEDRFGLVFEILDRTYMSRMRRERGFGVNPWRTHSRFLISHRLLIDRTYTDPMREWLGEMQPGSLLILDEAHHAAPSSGGRYGIETKITRAVRDLSTRFEHRLFLSATPHNGHSNSFSTLLELLDPYRFTRGVKVRQAALNEVMVRRLKEDIRETQGGFPKRSVQAVRITGLPIDAPELVLSRLLDEYRTTREKRHASASNKARAAAGLLVVGLQQRLLSSIEAFARSLKVHRETVERHWRRAQEQSKPATLPVGRAFAEVAAADDQRAAWSDDELETEEAEQIEALTRAAEDRLATGGQDENELWTREQALLDEMQSIADVTRHLPDAKTRYLIEWIRDNLCAGLPPFGQPPADPVPQWNDRRVLIFTENRQGTKRYLKSMLEQAIEGTDGADERIAVIDGLTRGPRRKAIQRRFNKHPAEDPLRILLATDAAREGLNFQAHCTDLFHFDLPWNPGRIEQRNGRIDRKLQPAPKVNCHYFVLPQRAEDRVLEVLVKKTETIKSELGSLSKVIDDDVERRLRQGIRHRDADQLRAAIQEADLEEAKKRATKEELEPARDRREALGEQIERCQNLLDRSRAWTGFDPEPFRDALSCSLELLDAPPLAESRDGDGNRVWNFPELTRRGATDPSWTSTLDSLRAPREVDQKVADWRRDAPIRPVVFKDAGIVTDSTVHLHLEQRVAQRLLARFRSQGFVHHDLSRACLVQASDSIPRVVLLGRLSLYGQRAERLHEEIVPVAARWVEPARRRDPLRSYGRDTRSRTLALLEGSMNSNAERPNEIIQRRLLESVSQDVEELRPHLDDTGEAAAAVAQERLARRGEDEACKLRETLEDQRQRVAKKLEQQEKQEQLTLQFSKNEAEQLNADIRHWRRRLERFETDLQQEPDRIRTFYEVRARRIEPLGIVYLWPENN